MTRWFSLLRVFLFTLSTHSPAILYRSPRCVGESERISMFYFSCAHPGQARSLWLPDFNKEALFEIREGKEATTALTTSVVRDLAGSRLRVPRDTFLPTDSSL